jgi:endonuclease YncB( thermonuclease family)
MEKVEGNTQTKSCRIIPVLLAVFLVFPAFSWAGQFKVTRVYDGDTLKAVGHDIEITVRLVGIDAPETSKNKHEPGQPFSQGAKKYLASLVLNNIVDVKGYGTDRYHRILGVVFVDRHNVNIEMVKAGLAEVYRGKPAKGLDLDPYRKAEAEAKKAKRGMWSLGDKYASPKEWRKMQKK